MESRVSFFICLNRAALGAVVEIQSDQFGSVGVPASRSGFAGDPQHLISPSPPPSSGSESSWRP